MSIQDVGIVNNPNEENQPDVEHFQYGDNVTDVITNTNFKFNFEIMIFEVIFSYIVFFLCVDLG